jgi:hypothetical protein
MPDTIHNQFLEEMATRIRALNLAGLAAEEVVVRESPWTERQVYKGVSLFELDESYSSPFGQPVNAEDIGYCCGVAIVRSRSTSSTGHVDRPNEWRIRIRREFLQKRLTTTAETGNCNIISTVHKLDMKPPRGAEWKDVKQLMMNFLLVICWVREQRNA